LNRTPESKASFCFYSADPFPYHRDKLLLRMTTFPYICSHYDTGKIK
jgi:hypothetical protein